MYDVTPNTHQSIEANITSAQNQRRMYVHQSQLLFVSEHRSVSDLNWIFQLCARTNARRAANRDLLSAPSIIAYMCMRVLFVDSRLRLIRTLVYTEIAIP